MFELFSAVSNKTGLSLEFTQALGVVFFILVFFNTLFFIVNKIKPSHGVEHILTRIKSWWFMVLICVIFLGINRLIATIGFGFLAYMAFRELMGMMALDTKFRRSIFWAYIAVPVQFYIAHKGDYYLFSVFIPVFMFLFLPFRNILQGLYENVTINNSKMHWSLMLSVYNISHLVFIMALPDKVGFSAGNACLVVYLIFLTQFNDVQQFLWGKAFGKRKIAPIISPNKTWAGFLGGLAGTVVLSYFLRFLTPMDTNQSLIMGALIAFTGFIGDLNISSIKRDVGLSDTGDVIPGHGGIMDRLDSLCFTAPIFVHLIYYWHYLG